MTTDESQPPLSVLVVEDEADGADSLAELLGLFGCRVAVARTGGDALRAAGADPPDVVLLDILLPDRHRRVGGRPAAAGSGGRRAAAGRVAVTGCALEADRRRSADAGVDLHWVKPADPAALLATLARFAQLLGRGRVGERHGARSRGLSVTPMTVGRRPKYRPPNGEVVAPPGRDSVIRPTVRSS